jgi:hypothetical protein
MAPGNKVIYFLRPLFMNVRNKLERLSEAGISNLVQCLRVRPEPTRVKYLSCAQL